MRYLIFLILLLGSACATHAPMSEMVMFNKESTENGKEVTRGIGITYMGDEISEEVFQQKQDGDYFDRDRVGFGSPISIHYFNLKKDKFGYSFSLVGGFGVDATWKLKEDNYLTALLSVNQSAKLILQRSIAGYSTGGLAPGIFLSIENRGYDEFCLDDPCYDGFGSENATSLYIAGLRGRFLIREMRKPGFALTGVLEVGHIFEVKEPFIGFNFSLTAF